MDLRKTIVPKSDQLNSDQLIGGNMTIEVTKVIAGDDENQPVSIYFKGDNDKPYKPCKTMRRLLVQLWGHDASTFKGRSMTLYRDESVKWAGVEVGGIRISHVSHIEKPTRVLETVGKGKKRPITIEPLIIATKKKMSDVEACKKAIEAGSVSIETIEATYELSEEQRIILKS